MQQEAMMSISNWMLLTIQFSFLIMAYLLGSLSFAVIVSRLIGAPDPRSYGSGNPGATNMLRSGLKLPAFLTLLGDGAKGWLTVALAASYQVNLWIVAGCGVLVLIGHLYPLFFNFKGGKGVATALGILLGFSPLIALLVLIVWLIVAALTRISSLAAIFAATTAPIACYILFNQNHPYFMATLIIAILVLYRHKSNLFNLLAKSEKPIDQAMREITDNKSHPQKTD
jgi:glycerol-3-phosphate acyltransferase PlsY